MNDPRYETVCDLCLDYLSGICTDEEKEAFEHHLPDCPLCKAELDELRIVWEALPTDMEKIDPPKDLKSQVMNAVKMTHPTNRKRQFWGLASGWKAASIAMTAACIILAAGSFWNYRLYQQRMTAPPTLEQALSVPAAQIENLVILKPQAGTSSKAYGVACIVDNGKSKQFIVYVFGAKATEGKQAYQVWLNNEKGKKSAGTFRVNDQGIGLLAMPLASDKLAFETIGITLEPDDRGDHPRGAKIFGSI